MSLGGSSDVRLPAVNPAGPPRRGTRAVRAAMCIDAPLTGGIRGPSGWRQHDETCSWREPSIVEADPDRSSRASCSEELPTPGVGGSGARGQTSVKTASNLIRPGAEDRLAIDRRSDADNLVWCRQRVAAALIRGGPRHTCERLRNSNDAAQSPGMPRTSDRRIRSAGRSGMSLCRWPHSLRRDERLMDGYRGFCSGSCVGNEVPRRHRAGRCFDDGRALLGPRTDVGQLLRRGSASDRPVGRTPPRSSPVDRASRSLASLDTCISGSLCAQCGDGRKNVARRRWVQLPASWARTGPRKNRGRRAVARARR